MFSLNGVKSVMEKLKKDESPGEVKHIREGRRETRYAYYLNQKMAFTFGLTRSSRSKSKKFYYVPQQMGITNGEYRKLHDCPWQKKELNKKLIELGIV